MSRTHVATRWWQRVLPVTALLLAATTVAALLLPGVREQLALSATHRPQQYVELSFSRGASGVVQTCTGTARRALTSFTVTSHLDESRDLAFTVTAGSVTRTGTVQVDPDETVVVDRALEDVGRRYVVTVELPELDQQIHARCPRRWAS